MKMRGVIVTSATLLAVAGICLLAAEAPVEAQGSPTTTNLSFRCDGANVSIPDCTGRANAYFVNATNDAGRIANCVNVNATCSRLNAQVITCSVTSTNCFPLPSDNRCPSGTDQYGSPGMNAGLFCRRTMLAVPPNLFVREAGTQFTLAPKCCRTASQSGDKCECYALTESNICGAGRYVEQPGLDQCLDSNGNIMNIGVLCRSYPNGASAQLQASDVLYPAMRSNAPPNRDYCRWTYDLGKCPVPNPQALAVCSTK